MAKFRVVDGKHNIGDGEYARKGDIIDLSPAEAAKFRNKFERVMVEEQSDPEPEESAEPGESADE